MKKLYFFIYSCMFFLGGGIIAFAQEQTEPYILSVPDTKIKEIVIRTQPRQNLEGKVWDMGAYYYCKFSRDDERKAVLDGWILVDPIRVEEIRAQASGGNNVHSTDVTIINAKESRKYGTYEVCIAGTKYTYIRRGDNYERYKKVDWMKME
ncbi:hypothetical protein [Myroides odoratus]|uniref:hypothetical protein n=1 Tax=Myroides odoratus TaxID=256 RepID=UPI0033420BE4